MQLSLVEIRTKEGYELYHKLIIVVYVLLINILPLHFLHCIIFLHNFPFLSPLYLTPMTSPGHGGVIQGKLGPTCSLPARGDITSQPVYILCI